MEILGVDYDNYAILYYCKSINSTLYSETARVLSRRTTLEKNDENVINAFLKHIFQRTEHKWRTTQQDADFCKPSVITTLSVEEVTAITTLSMEEVTHITISSLEDKANTSSYAICHQAVFHVIAILLLMLHGINAHTSAVISNHSFCSR
ncbi:uncharacterized protein LOC131288484 [Anopheles ziemanni]|nr:uncharacterized protein LOC131288484 [Anopheles ziemanni]